MRGGALELGSIGSARAQVPQASCARNTVGSDACASAALVAAAISSSRCSTRTGSASLLGEAEEAAATAPPAGRADDAAPACRCLRLANKSLRGALQCLSLWHVLLAVRAAGVQGDGARRRLLPACETRVQSARCAWRQQQPMQLRRQLVRRAVQPWLLLQLWLDLVGARRTACRPARERRLRCRSGACRRIQTVGARGQRSEGSSASSSAQTASCCAGSVARRTPQTRRTSCSVLIDGMELCGTLRERASSCSGRGQSHRTVQQRCPTQGGIPGRSEHYL